jgi:hypothetical protein
VRWMNGKDKVFAYGSRHGYLVLRSETEVRLSRFPLDLAMENLIAAVVAETLRNMISFPLGRGPGRPGGEIELNALMESAKVWAERYEAGESLPGYRAWQQLMPGVEALGRAAGRAMLGERTQRLLGLSLEDFEAAHDAGTLDLAAPHVAHLVMLLPFARDVPSEAVRSNERRYGGTIPPSLERVFTPPRKRGALAYRCPRCHAEPGKDCRTAAGLPTLVPHVSRQDLHNTKQRLVADQDAGQN